MPKRETEEMQTGLEWGNAGRIVKDMPSLFSKAGRPGGRSGATGQTADWTGWHPVRMGAPHSGPHHLKAGEETEQEDGGPSCGAALRTACPAALPVLPGWDVAQGGLAAGHGHQGLLCHLGDGLTCVCTPC